MKLYPEIILKASNNNKNVGAFRFWILAKDFDRGSGYIPAKTFRRHLIKDLKIARSTVYRWIDAAQELGLIEYNGDVYRLAAWDIGAMIAGVTELMRPVNMPIDMFINKGWMAGVWAAFQKHFKGPKSRAFFEAKTGVPARTQREYEAQAGTKKQANYADMGDPAKDPENAFYVDQEAGYYGGSDGHTRRRLPNTYEVPDGYSLANKGNTGKRNRRLKELHREGSIRGPMGRLYCEDDQQLKKARNQAKNQNAQHRWLVLFRHRCKSIYNKVGVYDAVVL